MCIIVYIFFLFARQKKLLFSAEQSAGKNFILVYITFNERQKLKENLGKWLGNFIYLFILQQILKHFLSPFDASVPGAFFFITKHNYLRRGAQIIHNEGLFVS